MRTVLDLAYTNPSYLKVQNVQCVIFATSLICFFFSFSFFMKGAICCHTLFQLYYSFLHSFGSLCTIHFCIALEAYVPAN